MAAPTGKGIYARDDAKYPGGDPAGYALAMDCQWVAFHHFATPDEHLQRAQAMGLKVYLYSTPDSWLPDTYYETLVTQAIRVEELGLEGFIADPERADAWSRYTREIPTLANLLGQAAARLPSVGVTSFPTWPWFRDLAEVGAPEGLWGSPQLYGVLEPADPVTLWQRGQPWREAFGARQYVPSLAGWSFGCSKVVSSGPVPDGACRRSLYDQEEYLEAFHAERGAIFWTASIYKPGDPRFELLREWNVASPHGKATALWRRFWASVFRPVHLPRHRTG